MISLTLCINELNSDVIAVELFQSEVNNQRTNNKKKLFFFPLRPQLLVQKQIRQKYLNLLYAATTR